MITKEHRQEQLSRAYVHAVAAHAGLIFEPATIDYGVDGCIRVVQRREGRRLLLSGHSLDVQLKATTNWRFENEEVIYDVEAKTYNDLVDRFNEPRGTPMVLIVMCLPKNEGDWLSITTEQLILRHCCFWCRVGGTRTDNNATQRIRIPRSQILDQTSVGDLLDKVQKGEVLL
jgi:hypothetical protein